MIRKKSGVPLLETFTHPLYLITLSPIVAALRPYLPKPSTTTAASTASIDAAWVGNLIYLILGVMETHLGKTGQHKRLLTKLPMAMFTNADVNGPLFIILKTAIQKPLSFWESALHPHNEAEVSDAMQLFADMETSLWDAHFLVYPKVYFGTTVPSSLIPSFRKIVSKHKGEIVKTEELATHVIEWDEEVDKLPEELADDFIRPIEFRYQDNISKVHWWYHPDSYDEFIPITEIDDPLEPPDAHFIPAQWRVCCRWVRDVEVFNEWGNEYDYELDSREETGAREMEDDDATASAKKKRARSRKVSLSWKKDALQGTHIVPTSNQSTEKMMPNFLPPSVDPRIEVLRVVDVTSSGTSLRQEIKEGTGSSLKRKATEEVHGGVAKKSNVMDTRRSSPPSWFSPDAVHRLERLHLSEFFDNSVSGLSEALYRQIRNFMVSEYSLTPHIYLSATSCRKSSSTDVRSVLSVHDFLDSYGIINYAVDPSDRPPLAPISLPLDDSIMVPGSLSSAPPKGSSCAKLTPDLESLLLDAVAECDAGDWTAVSAKTGDALSPAECLRCFAGIDLNPQEDHLDSIHTHNNSNLKNEDVARDMLAEYMALRMLALEEKVKLLRSVESLLDIEMDKVNLDKRDNQALRSQIALQQNQLINSGGLAGVLPSK